MFTTLVYGAEHRLSLTSPYFVPDESLLYAVTTAAQRGVEVELFVSEESDQFMVGHAQASYYRALLEAGVRIWMYPSPAILHSKHFSVDDTVGVIGSSNMDMRSFALNYEVSLMLLGDDVVHAAAGGRGPLPQRLEGAHPRGVAPPAPPPALGRQRHAPDRRPAVTVPGHGPAGSRHRLPAATRGHDWRVTDTERSARSSRTGFPVQLGLAALVTLFGAWQGFATYLGLSTVHPGAPIEALVYGAAIVGAAFILSWAAEAVQVDINAGLALALLALLAVLPEYAVDFVFTAKCGGEYAANGGSPEICGLSLANMTGANRVLVGVGWPLVVLVATLAVWHSRRAGNDKDDAREPQHPLRRGPPGPDDVGRGRLPGHRDALLADAAPQGHPDPDRHGGLLRHLRRLRVAAGQDAGHRARPPRGLAVGRREGHEAAPHLGHRDVRLRGHHHPALGRALRRVARRHGRRARASPSSCSCSGSPRWPASRPS